MGRWAWGSLFLDINNDGRVVGVVDLSGDGLGALAFVFENGTVTNLGTVPGEPDGSGYFEVPSRTNLFFQLLDAKGRLIQTMRDTVHFAPGEKRDEGEPRGYVQ